MKRKTIGICVCTLLIATTFACLAPAVSAECGIPDLRVSDLERGYIGPTRYWQMCYRLYNACEGDIVNENFTDKAWYFWYPNWYPIGASEKDQNNFYLEGQHTSGWFHYNWYAPPGLKFIQQWTDISEEVPDHNYDNNYKQKLYNWDDL